jgi:hypothetical protein
MGRLELNWIEFLNEMNWIEHIFAVLKCFGSLNQLSGDKMHFNWFYWKCSFLFECIKFCILCEMILSRLNTHALGTGTDPELLILEHCKCLIPNCWLVLSFHELFWASFWTVSENEPAQSNRFWDWGSFAGLTRNKEFNLNRCHFISYVVKLHPFFFQPKTPSTCFCLKLQ